VRGYSPNALSFLIVHVTAASLSASAAAQDSFFEDFDALDHERWYVSDGWTNGPHQACWWSSRAVDVRDGALILSLEQTGDPERPWACGEIQTNARFRHGTFEARLRTDTGSGVNAAFFTYIGEVHDRPHGEIDVEILTRDPATVEFNTFVSGEMQNGGAARVQPSADVTFHHYAFIWNADRVRWYVDGEMVHEAPSAGLADAQKIYLSHWNTEVLTDWMGPFENPGRPLEMHVDWVAWTAQGEDCQFAESIVCDREAE
jgi:endo-1,3-1,4-beta-glycanase ExoK